MYRSIVSPEGDNCLDQCWSAIIYFYYHSGIYHEEFPFIDTSRIRVIDDIFFSFGCIYNARTFILRQVSIWFGIILTQTSNWVYKDPLTLTYAPINNI
jgi:hypothetical protein